MKSLLLKIKAMSKTDIAAIVLFFAVFIYLVLVAFFDGTISDEAFYITIPLRLMNGDGLFTDEWHLSQLSSVLTYIPVKLFITLTGGTEGIILYIRLLFCLMQMFTGAVIYRALKNEGAVSIMISISFMLFSVIGLNTLSYNTMGLALLMLLICTVYSLNEKPSDIKMLLSGSLIAMFILCQPLGLTFYGIYFIAVCVFAVKKHISKKVAPYPFTLKSLLLTIIGILPVLTFFLYLLLKNSDIETIIKCIPGILSDVEHMEITEDLGIKTFSVIQFFNDMTMSAGKIPLIILLISIVISKFVSRYNRNIGICIALISLLFFLGIMYYYLLSNNTKSETDDINFCYLPIALSGLSFFLLCNKKNSKAFVLLWCIGIIYALFMTITSNIRLHSSVNGYIISSFGTFIFVHDLLKELKNNEKKHSETILKISKILCLAIAIFTICTPVVKFAISRVEYKSTVMQNGAYKGIHMPSDQALTNFSIYSDSQKIKNTIEEGSKVFVLENAPVAYIDGNFRMGAHSGWFIAEQLAYPEIRDRFRAYYEIFPENIPDYIYVPNYVYDEFGIKQVPAKKMAEFAYALFDGEAEDIGNGLLIKVTGIKDEQT